ncbi:MAG: flagellar biosynthetic protein FliO [Massilia sp.]
MRRSLSAFVFLLAAACAQAAPESASGSASASAAASAPDTAAVASPAPAPAPVLAPAPARPTIPLQSLGAAPSAGSLLQTILALTFVLGLLAAFAWLMKRYGPRGGAGSGVLRVVGAMSLGGRERVMVLEVGDQWIVVGASPGRINALATLPRPEGAAVPVHTEPVPNATFAAWLKQTLDKRNAP